MPETEQNNQNSFMIEKIKERPVNRKKLIRRTITTAAMAVIFGLIACVTFLLLEPVISNWLYPEEEPAPVVFPEDQEEMSPEDMLSDNLASDTSLPGTSGDLSLEEEQLQNLLSQIVLSRDNYKQLYDALSDYVNEMNRSMVTVTGVSSNLDWFNNVEESQNQSSGVIVANNGKELLVLVDYTPLKNAESLTMTFSSLGSNAAGYSVPAVLKGTDSSTNLAVLAASLTDIPAEVTETDGTAIASLGSSNTKNILSMPVIAMGSPMGSSGSVGYGMITATSSQSHQADTNYKLLQTDIYGSQNSGGVLFNLQGQVIGIITTQRINSDMKNAVTAYGISELKTLIEKMSNEEEIAYVGINGMDVTEEANEELGVPFGAFVRDVDMNSPSMRAGIQQGDVITSFGERKIRYYNDYINALMQAQPESTVELTVMRQAQGEYKEMKLKITLDKR